MKKDEGGERWLRLWEGERDLLDESGTRGEEKMKEGGGLRGKLGGDVEAWFCCKLLVVIESFKMSAKDFWEKERKEGKKEGGEER